MKITDLFEIVLPGEEVGLDRRVDQSRKNGIAFAIYASNFIPFQLKVTVSGNRQLAVAEFEKNMSAEEARLEIKKNGRYDEALIEDFLVVIEDQRLDDKQHPAIVCSGATFNSMSQDHDKDIPYMCVEEQKQENDAKKRVRSVGLAPGDASFKAGVKFLLVKKQ